MRAITRVAITAALLLGCVSSAVRAAGPITKAQCSIINPNPIVSQCSYYLPPIVDVYGDLPFDSVAAYSDCVKQRCVCTGAAINTDITTDGVYCNESGWMESGYTTCNVFNHCFTKFWQCMNVAVMDRYMNGLATTAEEQTLAVEIISHGNTPGEQFKVTDAYRSCRLIMCAAADSRENCGLITCLPNYTQCDEYMLPPPLPNTHQLCTQGCRAVLLMMALTIALVSFGFCCKACCPAIVIVTEPVIKDDDSEKKAAGEEDEDRSRSGSHHSTPTTTNHNSHTSNNNNNAEARQRGSD